MFRYARVYENYTEKRLEREIEGHERDRSEGRMLFMC